jgi:hypothetical protein
VIESAGAAKAQDDAVTLSADGHFTSREKTTPREGGVSRRGVSWSRLGCVAATVRTRRWVACL